MWGTIRLIHPFPATLVTFASLIFILVLHKGNPGWGQLFRATGVVAATQVAVGALNDYLDREVDAVWQPDKPLPAGIVTPAVALGLVAGGVMAFIPLAATFGAVPFAVICLAFTGGLAYDLWLKPTTFSLVGYLVGFLSLITWIRLITGSFSASFLLVYPAGAVLVIAAHLAQSFPDVESDAAAGKRGLAVHLGAAWTLGIIVLFSALVATGGLAVAIDSRQPLAIGLTAIAATTVGVAALLSRLAVGDIAARERLFFLVSPALALTGVGSLVALASLH